MRIRTGTAVIGFLLVHALAAQEPVNPPPGVALPAVDTLLSRLQADLKSQQSSNGTYTSLTKKVTDAQKALENGRAAAVKASLFSFDREVKGQQNGGRIDTKTAETLLNDSTAAQNAVDLNLTIPGAVPPPSFQPCSAPIKCPQYLELYVAPSQKKTVKPDGSAGAPYPTIADALARAAADHACGVEIILAAGRWDENILVDRPLSLRGAGDGTEIVGSLRNDGGYAVSVRNVAFRGSPDPGAIVVDDCPAATFIANVSISGAVRNGIRQQYGWITIRDTTVTRTVALPDERPAGFGVRLENTTAVLGRVRLSNNGAGGMLIDGEAAEAYIADSDVDGNNINPNFPVGSSLGASLGSGIVADHGAMLLSQFTNLDRNEFIGLEANNGARTHFRYGRIESTSLVTGPDGRMYGGINAVIDEGATGQLVSATLTDAQLADLELAHALASASDLWIESAPVGLYFEPPDGFTGNVSDCIEAVYIHVVLIYEGPIVVPCPTPTTCPGPTPACPAVTFACPWCSAAT